MMTEADYNALCAHLDEVRPVVAEFCARHKFESVSPARLGRYPRIRVERVTEVTVWLDLWMGLDENGRRFERFRRNLPYDLHGGVTLDAWDESAVGTRFGTTVAAFTGKPFKDVGAVLLAEMERLLPHLMRWDARSLKEQGKRTLLPVRSEAH